MDHFISPMCNRYDHSMMKPHLSFRLILGDDIALGPGKVQLLEAIRDTGSIAAAGREMGMSYKRAWHLVDTMNRCFESPLVEASKGGAHGGGAQLTPRALEVIALYRRLEARARKATETEMVKLSRHLATHADRS
jgi:molybdate transport system regulatory protein